MINSPAIEILHSLNSKELKLCSEYLRTPIFNKNKYIIRLYEYLIRNIKNKKPELLNKKYIFKQLFQDKPYNDTFMRALMSNLNKCIENFLIFTKFSGDDFGRKKYLLESFHEKGLTKQFIKTVKTSIESIEKSKRIDRFYYFERYHFEYLLNYYSFKLPRPFLKIKEIRYGEMENESSSLAIYFIISIMKRYMYLLNEKLLYPAKFNQSFYEEILKYAEFTLFKDIPIISFYYNFINLLKGKDLEKNYRLVKKFLFENYKVLDADEQYTHLTILANVNTVGTRAIDNEENFELYKFMLENKISMRGEENVITGSKFTAITIAAASLRKTEWLNWFFSNYKKMIPESERENTINYCQALQYYQMGNFEKSLKYLNNVKQDRLYSKLRVKSLLIRIYYEIGHYQESMDQIDTFRHFISSTKLLTKDFIKAYGMFIKFMRRLIKIKTGSSREKLNDFMYDLSVSGTFLADQWIISKAKEIEAKA